MVKAAQLIAGTIQSADGETFFLDLDNGILRIKAQEELAQRVEDNKTASDDQIGSLNEEIVKISKQVSQQITADQIRTEITTERQNAEETLRTTTGITMDERGVTVDKTGASTVSNMSENGLSITEGQNKVLTADNTGVDARNLRATTYLIVGGRIRMQNYWHDRGPGVACFWVGG